MSESTSRGVYGIAVASELTGVGEQTIRLYEKRGLVTPQRTAGGTRRYSEDDLAVVRRVAKMVIDGFNLIGARRVLELEEANERLQQHIDNLGRGSGEER